jgi:hypothetical protein
MTDNRFDQINRDLSRFGFLLHRDNRVIAIYCGAPDPILVREMSPTVLTDIRKACITLRPEFADRAFKSL